MPLKPQRAANSEEGEQVSDVKRRSAVVVFGLLTVALVVSLAACGGSSSDGSVKTYTDDKYGYSFEYPDDWKVEEAGEADVSAGAVAAGSTGVYDPEGAVAEDTFIDMMQVSVYELNVTVDESTMPAIKTEVETVVASLESQAGDIQTVAPLADAKVGGMDGYTVTYSFDKSGAPVTSALYFMFSGNLEYQLIVQAAEGNWEANQPIFEAILDSFEPGKAQ